jgi:hypothetical protein
MLAFLLDEIEARLAAAGFKRVHDQEHPRAFGSREVVWAAAKRVLRLIWDGKEYWIILQARPSSSIEWQDIRCERVKRDGLDETGRTGLIEALDAWLSSP